MMSAVCGFTKPAAVVGPTRGPELVVNGDMSDGVNGWVAGNVALLSWVDGKLRVTRSNTTNPFAYQVVPVVGGKRYELKGTVALQSLPSAQNIFRIGTSAGAGNFVSNQAVGARSITTNFIAQSSSVYLSVLYLTGVTGEYFDIDNISLREML